MKKKQHVCERNTMPEEQPRTQQVTKAFIGVHQRALDTKARERAPATSGSRSRLFPTRATRCSASLALRRAGLIPAWLPAE